MRVVLSHPQPGDQADFLAAMRASRSLHRPWIYPPLTPQDYRGYLARLDKITGAIDTSWQSAANNWVLDLLPHRESIFAVGWFNAIGGAARQAIARLPAAGDTIFVDDLDG